MGKRWREGVLMVDDGEGVLVEGREGVWVMRGCVCNREGVWLMIWVQVMIVYRGNDGRVGKGLQFAIVGRGLGVGIKPPLFAQMLEFHG